MLGKIVTRAGVIDNIDYRNVDNLQNLSNKIEKFARLVIEDHIHGGNSAFDPPAVKLETDFRDALFSRNLAEGVFEYLVLEKDRSGITESHSHTYFIDAAGNGFTVGILGDAELHFHNILVSCL